MANFVLLYSGGGMAATEEERAASLNEWMAWFGSLGAAVVDGGNPFIGSAKRVAAGGAVSDGAVGAAATGYSVLKADSFEAALELAKGCPVLKGDGQVTIYETINAM